MRKKRKHRNSQNKTTSNGLISLLSLFIACLGYLVNIRPKLGQYESGFIDCLLVIIILLALWFEVLPRRK